MQWYYIVMACGIPSIISGLFMWFFTKKMAKREDERKRAEIEALRRDKEMKKQNDALEKQSEVMEKQNAAMMSAIQAMLRDRLLQGYRHYFEKGWADYDDRENLENIYSQYHALGKNGIMDGFREMFLQLPVTKDTKMDKNEKEKKEEREGK